MDRHIQNGSPDGEADEVLSKISSYTKFSALLLHFISMMQSKGLI